jgi:hypothetical protein
MVFPLCGFPPPHRIELEQREYDANINGRDEFDERDEQLEDGLESTTTAKECARQFAVIIELLTAAEVGTS